jgi:hypothetical protein
MLFVAVLLGMLLAARDLSPRELTDKFQMAASL